MNKNEKKILKHTEDNLNNIYKSCKIIAKRWDKNSIALIALREAIQKAKPETDNEKLQEWKQKYDAMLDTLYEVCEQQAKNMDSGSVPLRMLKQNISIIKLNFRKGLGQT